MKLFDIKVDVKAVEDGEWIKDLPEMGDLRLKVRGQNSAAWRFLHRKLINALPRNIRNRPDGLPIKVQDEIMSKLLVGAGLLDWKNLELEDGMKPYSRELAEKLICDPEYALFRDVVMLATARVGTADAEAEEELAKNSGKPSAGN